MLICISYRPYVIVDLSYPMLCMNLMFVLINIPSIGVESSPPFSAAAVRNESK